MKRLRRNVMLCLMCWCVGYCFLPFVGADESNLGSIFEKISGGNAEVKGQQELIETSFDLKEQSVSEYMVNALNHLPQKRGEKSAADVMAGIFAANPTKALGWIVDHYDELSATGRANIVNSLRLSKYAEAPQVIASFLNDKQQVINARAEALSPGPYEHLRVCDYAYNSLCYIVAENIEKEKDLPRRISSDMPDSARMKYQNNLKRWWSDNGKSIQGSREHLTDAKPSLKVKLNEFLIRKAKDE